MALCSHLQSRHHRSLTEEAKQRKKVCFSLGTKPPASHCLQKPQCFLETRSSAVKEENPDTQLSCIFLYGINLCCHKLSSCREGSEFDSHLMQQARRYINTHWLESLWEIWQHFYFYQLSRAWDLRCQRDTMSLAYTRLSLHIQYLKGQHSNKKIILCLGQNTALFYLQKRPI